MMPVVVAVVAAAAAAAAAATVAAASKAAVSVGVATPGSLPLPPGCRQPWTQSSRRVRSSHPPAARPPSRHSHRLATDTRPRSRHSHRFASAAAAAGLQGRGPTGARPSLPARATARPPQPPLWLLLLLLLLVVLLGGGGGGVAPVVTPVAAAKSDSCEVLPAETCASSCVPFEDGRDFRCSDFFYTERCCNGTVAVFPSELVYYRCSCVGVGLTGQGLAVIGCSVLAGLAAAVAVGVYVLFRRRKRLDAVEEERARAVEEATSYLPR